MTGRLNFWTSGLGEEERTLMSKAGEDLRDLEVKVHNMVKASF